ncbi:inverse autotransporter beta domain-containing protein [Pseudomonas guariconensis]|uniref:inverse autotransporter beta domain-containing protein n=1 Tax=Pseudomonas guariconensis TaxID=1288410 RepID=UPI0018A9C57E|nr:inverse autotransporter beta domain-containing protein [Pseudomonas guariconensis]MBF8733671.1 inverse autotransporter beta domain-containing protein [Pseudomonas guariconensis]
MIRKSPSQLSLPTRALAWMNIAIQAVLPLTVALTPTHAGAASDQTPGTAQHQRTVLHTLAPGETVERVAARFNMSVAELRTLNQDRTFANGFDNLRPGDRLEVPSTPRMALPELNSSGLTNTSSEQNQEAQSRKLAGVASSTANFLTSDVNKGDAAASMARGMAVSEVSAQTQEWLSRYGTARVQINVDDKLSLASSSLDLLLPVHDTEKHLLFTQGSIHRTDDRNQANLGVGVRRFNDGYMVGVNTFFDHDLSRSHSRLGVGVEYWRDYLKLSANGYHRLSNWRTSPDLVDYEERPANGWDVRAEGWLPSMPQLGGKLTYEKYYGNEVGLFGKDNRKKNPHAVTTGVTYTPIPLLTFSAEQRRGDAGASDTQFGMQFNWSLGQSWNKQTDPSQVAAMRTLAGSRYDLVERNNNIVLEYRKKEVIRLNVPRQVAGAGGERKSLQVTVQSKYGLDRIDWSADTLLQAGGKIEHLGGSDYQLTLPNYRTDAQAVNTYTLHGVAVDRQGNRSNRSETQVTVNAPVFDAARSTFLPSDSVVPTKGGVQVLTLTVRDAQDGLIDVPLSDLSMAVTHGTAAVGATVSDFSQKSLGVYEVTVTTGTLPQSLTLTPSIQSTALASAKIAIVDRVPDAGTSAFKVTPDKIDTSGTTVATLTLTANDADGSPVPDIADKLTFLVADAAGTAPGTGITLSQVTETSPGSYTARLSGTKAGVLTVTPQYLGSALGTLNGTVTLSAGPIAAVRSSLTAAPNPIEATGSDISTLTLTVKDAEDNPVSDIADKLTFRVTNSSGGDGGSDVTVTSLTESAPGVYKANLSGTKADTWTVTPLFESAALALEEKVIMEPGAVDVGKSAFTANPPSVVVGTGESDLKLEVNDAQGNPVSGIAANLSFDVRDSFGTPAGGEVTITRLQETTPGIYTAKLSGTKAEVWTVTPQLEGSALSALATNVTLVAGTLDTALSKFTAAPNPIDANGSDSSQLTLSAKDAKNNPIPGLATKLTFTVKNDHDQEAGTAVTIENLSESAPGTYTATLKGTKADTWTVALILDGAATGMSEKVVLTAGVVDAGTSTIAAAPDTITANGSTPSELTFTAKDAKGNPVTGIVGDLAFDVTDSAGGAAGSDVTVDPLKETTPGTYTATLKGTKADVWTVTPQFKGSALGSLAAKVTLTPDAPDAGRSSFAAAPTPIEASGSAYSVLTFTAMDAKDNPVTNSADKVTFGVKDSSGGDAGSEITVTEVKETSPGVYEAKLSGTKADIWTVTPLFESAAVGSLSETVTLIAGPVAPGTSSFTANPPRVLVGSGDTSKLKFTAQDAHNNPVTGIASKLKFIVEGTGGIPAPGEVDVSAITEVGTTGEYTAELSGTLVGTYTVTPQADTVRLDTLATSVELVKASPPADAYSKIEVTKDRIYADRIDQSQIRFTAMDASNQPISGIEDQIRFQVQDNGAPVTDITISAITEEGNTGVYVATLSGEAVGKFKVVPLFEGSELNISEPIELFTSSFEKLRNDYGWEYQITSTYPRTGYEGAKFTVLLSNNADPNDYDWTSDAPWLTSRGAGTFEFTADPTGGTRVANITAQRKGSHIKYERQIKNQNWFWFSNDSISRTIKEVEDVCAAKGMNLVDTVRYSGGFGFPAPGGILNEWGSIPPNIANNYFIIYEPLSNKLGRAPGTYEKWGEPVGSIYDPSRLICVY